MASIPIAIIGMSCRFPGDAENPAKFWDLLREGREAYSESSSRYNEKAFYHPGGQFNNKRQNVLPVRGGYTLKQDIHAFDAAFFNITAAEAISFDPKQRLAMEVTYEAFENAGMSLSAAAGTKTACYIGTSMSDYRDSIVRDFGNYPKYHLLGTSDEMISNRVSHFFDLRGPSATIETACSSSHVATHIACQSIRSGESDLAVVGGVGLLLVPESTMQLNNLGFLSPFGQSRAFDASGAGYGRGEGCGIFILKRLDKALSDGDNIRAVIRGSGVNSDGWTQGVTMPSGEAQATLIDYVYKSNGLEYQDTQYVEAHGTGTKVGDPTEAEALSRTIGQATNKRKKLFIGSVKTNIGHLEAAAGAASMVKGVLAMEHGFIPPTLHFKDPNPAIKFDEWNLSVPTTLIPWPLCDVRRMSTSAFGMGGTNAHIVMENPQSAAAQKRSLEGLIGATAESALRKKRLFVFSAHDQAGLTRVAKALDQHLDEIQTTAASPQFLADLASTLAAGRSGLSWKSACSAGGLTELREHLGQATVLEQNAVRATDTDSPRIGFIFTGQGAQWARMGVELLERKTFRESVELSGRILKELGCAWDPVEELLKDKKESRLVNPAISQPICSVLQIALVDELTSWGVRPAKIVGHSSGEIAAAYCSGALSHRDALAAAYHRGTASQLIKRKGGMMAVGATAEAAKELIKKTGSQITVACVNSPQSITLSGDVEGLEELREVFESQGAFARRLKVDVAYHSSHMQQCSASYLDAIRHIEPLLDEDDVDEDREAITMVSSVTGQAVDPEELGPYYWVRNLVSPVLFSDALHELVTSSDPEQDKDIDVLVEVGPHSALGGPAEQILSHGGFKNVRYSSMLKRGESALDTSLRLAAHLYSWNVKLDMAKVNADTNCQLLMDLPPYPFNHTQKYRAESRLQREILQQNNPKQSLLGSEMPSMAEYERVWRGFVNLDEEPWLRGHTVGSTVLFPGAGVISLVLEAAKQLAEEGKTPRAFAMRDISFLAMIALSEGTPTEIITHIRPHLVATTGNTPATWFEFTVSSCTGVTSTLRTNCRGLISIQYEDAESTHNERERDAAETLEVQNYQRVLSECPDAISKSDFYGCLARSALPYGPHFQGVKSCHPGSGKSVFEVAVTDLGETFSKFQSDRAFLIHGATLDAVLQAWVGTTKDSAGPGSLGFDKPLLPKSIGSLEVSAHLDGSVGYTMPGSCKSEKHGFNEWSAEISMFDRDLSQLVLKIEDFRLTELEVDADDSPKASKGKNTIQVNAAEIASSLRWDFASEFLDSEDLHRILAGKSTTDALRKLTMMAIHHQPALKIVEFVQETADIDKSVISSLPNGSLLLSQVRFAVALVDNLDNVNSEDGQPAPLESLDAASSSPSADLIIASYHYADGFDAAALDRLANLASADQAKCLVVGNAQTVASSTALLEAKGFQTLHVTPLDENGLSVHLFQKQDRPAAPTMKLVNGSVGTKLVIIEAVQPSDHAHRFCEQLQEALEDAEYNVSVVHGLEEAQTPDDARIYVSLLELENALLANLSSADFEALRGLFLKGERVLWITRNGQPDKSLIDGLSRTIRGEFAGLRFEVLHLDPSSPREVGASLAAKVVFQKSADSEFRESNGTIQVARAYRDVDQDALIRSHLVDTIRELNLTAPERNHVASQTAYKLAIGKPGLLNTLHYVADESISPKSTIADDEVEIQVKASGINFRDIMGSMGLLAVSGIGQEASGIVTRVGKRGARMLQPGDRVSTLIVGGTHATSARCDYRVCKKIPAGLSFAEAASVPVTHCTAYYALVKLAKLQQGQSVLIHAAAGGTGQAAVQLAKQLGLTVYATVGSRTKRALLKEQYGIPDKHIFHSRDGSFVQGIQRVTNGRGVDCVLNSLSGELLRLSWGCLATFGTFVEIGLRDITDNMRLDMRPFAKSTTFSFINMVTLLQENPEAMSEILDQVFDLLEKRVLKPAYPLSVYPYGKVEEAFRLMQQGKHLGKMVLSFEPTEKDHKAPVLCRASESLKLDGDVTYLLIGGLGGLGRSLALQMIACGARHLAFLSRSGDTKPEAKAIVEELKAAGVQVQAYRCDVADEASFRHTMKQCSAELPPIKGVIQMAMVLRDVVFEKMTYEDWIVGLAPKVAGTRNVGEYFDEEHPLDFMLFFSSIAGVFGNPSQAQYAAGNTYQDALASSRRERGLKAVSVNLGIMRDVGVIAEGDSHFMQQWEEALGIREPAFHALIKSLIDSQLSPKDGSCHDDDRFLSSPSRAQVTVGLGTGDILARNGLREPHYFEDPRFGPLTVRSELDASALAAGETGGASVASRLAKAAAEADPTAAAGDIIAEALVSKLASILQVPTSEIDASRPMYKYGVDSLVALEVRNWITKEIGANVALMEILGATPIEQFALVIAKKSKILNGE